MTIVVNDGEFRDITAQAVRALVVGNRPDPTVFTFGTSLARLRQVDGPVFIEPLNIERLTNHLAEVADWRKIKGTDNGSVLKVARPDRAAVTNVLAERNWPVPRIERVVTTPGFRWTALSWSNPATTTADGCSLPPCPTFRSQTSPATRATV